MCGIAGMLARDPASRPDPAIVRRMTAAIAHRGPDGSGFHDDGPVAFGHRRLAIIDLSDAARQPMTGEDGEVVAMVNGEIYNHRALRAELEGKGHVFRSASDSEVIVHLYEEVGAAMPGRLRGMFALAVWDRRRRRLLLARDRAGEKPLYYARRPDGLAFASEIGALLADPGTPATVDTAALDAYLALQYVPGPGTIFDEIRKLPPGHLLEVGPGDEPVPRRYHDFDFAPRLAEIGEGEAAERVRAAVDDAVRVRLMSDVPLGAFLSGGIDSSIVVACMARASDRPVKTFSIGFPDAGDSELPYARLCADRWKTDHEEQIVSPDMVAVLPEIVRHHGEPFGDPSAVPCYYLARMTRGQVTVALSGDGGDEGFAGYKRYVWAHLAHLVARLSGPAQALVAAALRAIPGGAGRGLREYGAHLRADEASRYLRFVCHFSAAEKAAIYAPDLAARFAEDRTAQRFADHLAASRAGDPLGRLMDLDVHTYLPDDILTKVDIATMTHGLEARAPLVDHHVLELGAALPTSMKLRGLAGKRILRRAFADAVPEPILRRKKKGFSLPLARWFRGDRLRDYARDILLASGAGARGLFRAEAVEDLFTRHQAGEDHGDRLWNLAVLETWFREMVDGRRAFMDDVTRRVESAPPPAGPGEPAKAWTLAR